MDPQAFACRGYGECVLWQSLLDGQPDCIDGSDEGARMLCIALFVSVEI